MSGKGKKCIQHTADNAYNLSLMVKEESVLIKNREITNPGLGSLRVRPDKLILAAGGWDYRCVCLCVCVCGFVQFILY